MLSRQRGVREHTYVATHHCYFFNHRLFVHAAPEDLCYTIEEVRIASSQSEVIFVGWLGAGF